MKTHCHGHELFVCVFDIRKSVRNSGMPWCAAKFSREYEIWLRALCLVHSCLSLQSLMHGSFIKIYIYIYSIILLTEMPVSLLQEQEFLLVFLLYRRHLVGRNVGRWHVFNVSFLLVLLFVCHLHNKCSYHSRDCMLSFSFIRMSTFNCIYTFLFPLDVHVPAWSSCSCFHLSPCF